MSPLPPLIEVRAPGARRPRAGCAHAQSARTLRARPLSTVRATEIPTGDWDLGPSFPECAHCAHVAEKFGPTPPRPPETPLFGVEGGGTPDWCAQCAQCAQTPTNPAEVAR